MMIWLAIAAMTLVVTAILLWSLVRARPVMADRREIELAVARDQLSEVSRDAERGLLAQEEAESARIEVARRLLAHDRAGLNLHAPAAHARIGAWWLSALVAPVAALALYAAMGAPQLKTEPAASAEQNEMVKLVNTLAQKMTNRPNDLDGWKLLARSAAGIGQFEMALDAFRKAIALDGNKDMLLVGDFAETLVLSQRGVVPEARHAFDAVLAADPKDARALYYLAQAQAQIGAWNKAVEQWSAILKDAPPDADYIQAVQARISEARERLGQSAAQLPAPSPQARQGGPTSEDVAAAANMNAGDRAGMIESMVARLAERLKANPDDAAGWRKLGRAYLVLGRIDDAVSAYGQSTERDPKSIEGFAGLAQALRQQTPNPDAEAQARYGQVLARLIALDPNNGDALFDLGAQAARAKRIDAARDYWTRLLEGIPKDEPVRKAALAKMRQIADEAHIAPSALGLDLK
jgi:cytochrome c-type biogenesis protein CcmH